MYNNSETDNHKSGTIQKGSKCDPYPSYMFIFNIYRDHVCSTFFFKQMRNGSDATVKSLLKTLVWYTVDSCILIDTNFHGLRENVFSWIC